MTWTSSVTKSVRRSELYVSPGVLRCLRAMAKREGGESTADSVGDRVLSEYFHEKQPELVKQLKEIEKLESKLVEAVKG